MGEIVEVGGEHGFVRCADLKRMHLCGAGNTLALAGVFLLGIRFGAVGPVGRYAG